MPPEIFRMPAEWERHEATWLAWPHERTDWPGKFEPIRWVYAEVARWLSVGERVRLLVPGRAEVARIEKIFRKSGVNMNAVDFYVCPTDRSWTRDFCPIFVRDQNNEVVIGNWRFNGWAKYDNWRRDNAVPTYITRRLGLRQLQLDLVLEGGSIDVNGCGAMLTTTECLLSDVQARNPGLGRLELEAVFAKYLGISRVYWLERGIAGDDTHGHVDDLARFVNPDTVVTVVEDDRADDNYEPLRENLRILRRTPFRVVKLPMPRPVWFDGQRLPASYANFYIANAAVLVPTFNDPADRVALATLGRLFQDRPVVGIHCRDLVLGLGALHCMTQQQP